MKRTSKKVAARKATKAVAKAAQKAPTKSGMARRFVPVVNEKAKAEHDAAVARHARMAADALAKANAPTPRKANGQIASKKAAPITAKEAVKSAVNKALKNGSAAIVEVAAPAKGNARRPASTAAVTLPEHTGHNPYGRTPDESGPFKTRADAEAYLVKKGWSDCKSFEVDREWFVKKRDLKPAVAKVLVLDRPATLQEWTAAMVYKAMRKTRITYMLDDESPREALLKALAAVELKWSDLWDDGTHFVHVYTVAGRTVIMAETPVEDALHNTYVCSWDATMHNLGDHEINDPSFSRFDAEVDLSKAIIAFDVECRANKDL